jgi:hypothetical protein
VIVLPEISETIMSATDKPAQLRCLYHVSTHGRFRPERCGGFGADRNPLLIQWRVSIGSIT